MAVRDKKNKLKQFEEHKIKKEDLHYIKNMFRAELKRLGVTLKKLSDKTGLSYMKVYYSFTPDKIHPVAKREIGPHEWTIDDMTRFLVILYNNQTSFVLGWIATFTGMFKRDHFYSIDDILIIDQNKLKHNLKDHYHSAHVFNERVLQYMEEWEKLNEQVMDELSDEQILSRGFKSNPDSNYLNIMDLRGDKIDLNETDIYRSTMKAHQIGEQVNREYWMKFKKRSIIRRLLKKSPTAKIDTRRFDKEYIDKLVEIELKKTDAD